MPSQSASSIGWLENAALDYVQHLMAKAITSQNIYPKEIGWTQRRWDQLDITASWPLHNPSCNLHAVLNKHGWSFMVSFEGAAWQDDEEQLLRVVRFFPNADSNSVHPQLYFDVRGSAEENAIQSNSDASMDALLHLVSEIKSAQLSHNDHVYLLEARPLDGYANEPL